MRPAASVKDMVGLPEAVTACLFDLDGVLTSTAVVHRRAWKRTFDEFLRRRDPNAAPFTEQDYATYVDGRPRLDGTRGFLESRGIHLPEGEPADPPDAETVCGLGNRKNDAFNAVLARDGVAPFPGSVALLDVLRGLGMPLAVVSSSVNAPAVIAAAGLEGRFVTVVDGRVAHDLGLPGKPAPDTFLHAASACGSTPGRSVVVEDAVSGVRAGATGGFGLVIGVDRGAGAEVLTEAGAHVVVSDLGELA